MTGLRTMAGVPALTLAALVSACLAQASGFVQYGQAAVQQTLSDQTFSPYLLFESPARSEIECSVTCACLTGCVTFTFEHSTLTCRGHWSVAVSSGPSTASPGAKTRVYVPNTRTLEWMILQRRRDGSVDFYRPWADYVNGFGNLPDGEFWIGLETMHVLTSEGNWTLRFDMEDWEGKTAYATYTGFYITNSADNYRLKFDINSYSGTAGDSLASVHNMQFTTKDADHDQHGSNCAVLYPGGWWARTCFSANPNGVYMPDSTAGFGQGVFWDGFRGHYYSLKSIEMKMKRTDYDQVDILSRKHIQYNL